jgi:hypothetical protein
MAGLFGKLDHILIADDFLRQVTTGGRDDDTFYHLNLPVLSNRVLQGDITTKTVEGTERINGRGERI